jgi:hypothetical protein
MCFFSKKREVVPELAPMLWHSFGTVAALLQEIINIYPAINPPHLTVSITRDIRPLDSLLEMTVKFFSQNSTNKVSPHYL